MKHRHVTITKKWKKIKVNKIKEAIPHKGLEPLTF